MTDIFITGTDTDAGKTYVTGLIAQQLLSQGRKIAVFKPIASGCDRAGDPLSNSDLALYHQITGLPAALINIYCFDEPIAPHIAAAKSYVNLSVKGLQQEMRDLKSRRHNYAPYDFALIEGAGGWKLPLNSHETLDLWVGAQGLDVILVVGMKLGCINHALLTSSAILAAGGQLIGWIANSAVEMPFYQENLDSLQTLLPVPLLAEVRPHQTTISLDICSTDPRASSLNA